MRFGDLQQFKKNAFIAIAVALWLPTVCYGVGILWTYASTPGHPAEPPLQWPANASVSRGNGHATLLMFAHPQCPCTRASLSELAVLMAQTHGQVEADVFFYIPAGESSGWAKTDLWQAASAIPGVRAFTDPKAAAAQQFGVFTSGQALLYEATGRLLFKGGITALRGHPGDNAGRSAVTALVQGQLPPANALPVVTPVFGCSLIGE